MHGGRERTEEESRVKNTQESSKHQEAGVSGQKLVNSPASHEDNQSIQSIHRGGAFTGYGRVIMIDTLYQTQ